VALSRPKHGFESRWGRHFGVELPDPRASMNPVAFPFSPDPSHGRPPRYHRSGVMENTLIRSTPSPECGDQMLWTQNAWQRSAAYRCVKGHVLDPATTRQCPACGLHDTELVGAAEAASQFRSFRCGTSFRSHVEGM
jgi:hypothetical protein